MSSFDFNTNAQTAKSWTDRAEKCADLLTPLMKRLGPSASLADVGCGDEKLAIVLRERGIQFEYTGFDLRPQSERVIPFDVTRDALSRNFDIVVSLGLIEYINIPAYLSSIRPHCKHFVVSHVARNRSKYSPEEITRLGWLNHLSEQEIDNLLAEAGFIIDERIITANAKTVLWLCS